jgi:hypothetical protein
MFKKSTDKITKQKIKKLIGKHVYCQNNMFEGKDIWFVGLVAGYVESHNFLGEGEENIVTDKANVKVYMLLADGTICGMSDECTISTLNLQEYKNVENAIKQSKEKSLK